MKSGGLANAICSNEKVVSPRNFAILNRPLFQSVLTEEQGWHACKRMGWGTEAAGNIIISVHVFPMFMGVSNGFTHFLSPLKNM